MPRQRVVLADRRLSAGSFSVSFERTLRVPDDGRVYPLPPSLGSLPIYRTTDFNLAIDAGWKEPFLVPIRQAEALWLSFRSTQWRAVQIGCGGVNAITGEPFPSPLSNSPQNYIVCPTQPWLDGFTTAPDSVRQFVAAPLGQGLTVSEQLGGGASPSLTFQLYTTRQFLRLPPPADGISSEFFESVGLGAGGYIKQRIYEDPLFLDAWNKQPHAEVCVRTINSNDFRQATGQEPEPEVISAADYSRLGFPWFEIYDESLAGLTPAEKMLQVKSLNIADEPAKPRNIRRLIPWKPS